VSTTHAGLEASAAATDRRARRRLSARRATSQRDQLADILAVAIPSLLALALCLYQITTRSLWLDESATVAIASQHGSAFGAALARDGGNMLGYYALLHVLIGWFGSGALVIRLPAAVAATATVALVAVLGLRLADRRVAAVAGVVTAVNLSLVYWGQDARGYTPMVALVVGSFLALLAILERRGGRGPWIGYVVCTTAAVYMGLEAALIIPAQLLMLVWFRDRWRPVVTAVAVTAACCIPLAVLAAGRGSGQLFWVPNPSLRVLWQIVQALTSSGLQPSFYTSTTTALAVLTLVVLVAGAARTWQLWRTAGGEAAWRPALMLAWLIVPALVALIESAIGQSIFQARYLLVSLPAVSLLLAWTLADRRVLSAPRPTRLLAVGAVTALIVIRGLQLAPAYGVSPENWRGATAYVVAHAQPRDCIAFYPLDNRQAFRYYLRDFARGPRPILPAVPWSEVRPFVEDYASLSAAQLAALPQQCGRVWLVASHEGKVGGPPTSHGNYVRFHQLTSSLRRHFPAAPRSLTFSPAGVVTVTLYSG
jgi:4-amino-4-deoxy-L-arabinose transferase-like glycosyltransferase